jgi:pimeloyl-ACP methyl ester carboxylesterase
MFEFNESDCQFTQVNGLKFRYYDKGQGQPLILLHGFPDDLTVWKKMIPLLLAEGYRVIAFDQRGFGESDMPLSKKAYQISNIVSDIPVLLENLGTKEPVYLMGHDWGSVIAWAFSLEHPKCVLASVNISVGHPESYRRSGISQKLVKGFYTLWFQLRGLAEFYLKWGGLKRWLGSYPEPDMAIQRMLRKGRLTAGLNWYRANFSGVVFQSWPMCDVPSLSVWSDKDDYLTEKQVLDSERYMLAEWAYYKVENAGHWIPLEQPEILCKQAIIWFRKKF